MPQTIVEEVEFRDTITETLSYGAVSALPVQGAENPTYSWTNGTTANKVDLHWEKGLVTPISLAAGADVTYTLSALTDELGRTVAFARVRKYWLQVLTSTNDEYLTVGGAATHAWTAIEDHNVYGLEVKVAPGTNALVVAAGSDDQLLITNPGMHTITFAIGFSGASA